MATGRGFGTTSTLGSVTPRSIASPKALSLQLGALLDRSWCLPADETILSGGLPGMVANV